jgi:hypothetical protein
MRSNDWKNICSASAAVFAVALACSHVPRVRPFQKNEWVGPKRAIY